MCFGAFRSFSEFVLKQKFWVWFEPSPPPYGHRPYFWIFLLNPSLTMSGNCCQQIDKQTNRPSNQVVSKSKQIAILS